MFFYAARTDKNGHRLLTSYNNAASQKKYGGSDATLFQGIQVLGEDGFEVKDTLEDVNDPDMVVRSRMYNPHPENTKTGKFVIRSLNEEGVYVDTPFRTNSYGAANTIMKAVIPMYQELIVVEEGALPYGGSSGTSGDAPF